MIVCFRFSFFRFVLLFWMVADCGLVAVPTKTPPGALGSGVEWGLWARQREGARDLGTGVWGPTGVIQYSQVSVV